MPDVMRGEETQLIGLLKLLRHSGSTPTEGLLIFPGTHSKHIYLSERRVVGFKTFMTGELYSVLSKNSILKDSIQNGDMGELSDEDAQAFKAGVKESAATGILNGLFTVRTNQLFSRWEKAQNAFYLSGLLIGEELNYLLKRDELPLILCSGKNLYKYYQLALDELNLSCRTTTVPFELVDMAAVAGQQVIFEKHIKRS
jgi:2-dehydro-3-deoxygalactonokinase